jgi:hypothetical protein
MLLYRIKGKYRPMFLVWGEVLECKHQNHIYASRSSFVFPSPLDDTNVICSSLASSSTLHLFLCLTSRNVSYISLSLPVLCWKSFVSFYSPSYFLILVIIPNSKFNTLSMCMLMYSSSVWHYYYCNQVKLYSSHKSILPSLYRDGTKRPSEQQETVYPIQLLYCPIEG